MSLSDEKLLSPEVTVTGSVTITLRAIFKFKQMSKILLIYNHASQIVMRYVCNEGSSCTLYLKLQVLCINIIYSLLQSAPIHSASLPPQCFSMSMDKRNPYSSQTVSMCESLTSNVTRGVSMRGKKNSLLDNFLQQTYFFSSFIFKLVVFF